MLIGIVGRAPEIEAQLRHVVAAGSFTLLPPQMPATPAEMAVLLGEHAFPDVLMLAPDGDPYSVLPLTRALSAEQKGGVVLVVDGPDLSFTVEGLKSGAADVIARTASQDEIRGAVARAAQIGQRAAVVAKAVQATPVERAERGTVVLVGSAVGGVGKTSLAVNLAVGLAGIKPGKVALVDAVPQFGGVHTHLDIKAIHTLPTIVGATDSIAAKTYLFFDERSGLYVAPADENPAEGDRLEPDPVMQTVEMLARQFETVVVDVSTGLTPINLELLTRADQLLLVSDFSVHSLRATRLFLKAIKDLPRARVPLFVRPVLNRFDKVSALTQKDAEETIEMPVELVLENMPRMLFAANRGEPPMLRPANDPLRVALSPLVGMFHEIHDEPKRAARRLFR